MSRVVVEPLHGPGLHRWLDTSSGRITPATAQASAQGWLSEQHDRVFALYVDAGTLYFQWDGRRWPFAAEAVVVRYSHDHARKTTTFSIGERSLEYPAWWADDPQHEPLVPELDAEYDDLAWFATLKRDPERQAKLLKRWSEAA